MTGGDSELVAGFTAAAEAARRAEEAFRREAAARIEALERERTHAFRRLAFLRLVADALGEDADAAPAAARAAVLRQFGWSAESEPHARVLDQLAPFIGGVAAARLGMAGPELPPAEALARFEAWYRAETGTAFWDLFDRYVPETPVVDF